MLTGHLPDLYIYIIYTLKSSIQVTWSEVNAHTKKEKNQHSQTFTCSNQLYNDTIQFTR